MVVAQEQLCNDKDADRSATFWLGQLSFSCGLDRAAAVEEACDKLVARLPDQRGAMAASLFRSIYTA